MSITSRFQGKTKWFIFTFVLFLLLTLSFGVGYLVAKEVHPAPIIIEKCSELK